MGYTHYWRSLKPTKELAEITKEIIRISGVKICNEDGTGKPIVEEDYIGLNGTEENDQCHESFYISNKVDDFNFCKTARKPYDKVVVAILVGAIDLEVPGCESITSDGDVNDWKDGIKLYCEAYENIHGHLLDWKFVKDTLESQIGNYKKIKKTSEKVEPLPFS